MNETEEEQVEALKKWWAENGKAIIFGVILGGGAIFGWRYWEAYQVQQAEAASSNYQNTFSEFIEGNLDNVSAGAALLRKDYASSPYASLASLLKAKLSVDKNNLEDAAEALRWAMENTPEEDVRHIATLRLARVLSAQGEHTDAFNLLDATFPAAFAALVDELKGDILLAQGNTALAREAYTRALGVMQTGEATNVLQMKLDDLGVDPQS